MVFEIKLFFSFLNLDFWAFQFSISAMDNLVSICRSCVAEIVIFIIGI